MTCAIYSHAHGDRNCRCIKLCQNCGRSRDEHGNDKEALIDQLVELLYDPAKVAPASRRRSQLLS